MIQLEDLEEVHMEELSVGALGDGVLWDDDARAVDCGETEVIVEPVGVSVLYHTRG